MFGSSAKITVTLFSKDPEFDAGKYFDTFKTQINELIDGSIDKYFRVSNIVSEGRTISPTPTGQVVHDVLPELAGRQTYYRSDVITDPEIFKFICLSLKCWQDKYRENFYRTSLEIVVTGLKFPLYIRKGKFMPPDTFYHLKMVSKQDQEMIDLLNKEVFGIEKS